MTRRCPLILALLIAGCVERTVSISTEPQGAKVTLNDQEVGDSPVKVAFTWYGDYDIIVRKPGYETLRTNHRIDAPWYQLPFIDLLSECLVPFTIRDDRVLPVLLLSPRMPVDKQALLDASEEMRKQTAAAGPEAEPATSQP